MSQQALDEAQNYYLSLLLDRGCKFLFIANWPWAKGEYVFMKDPFGAIFVERIPEREPTYSVDGQTGEVTPVR